MMSFNKCYYPEQNLFEFFTEVDTTLLRLFQVAMMSLQYIRVGTLHELTSAVNDVDS